MKFFNKERDQTQKKIKVQKGKRHSKSEAETYMKLFNMESFLLFRSIAKTKSSTVDTVTLNSGIEVAWSDTFSAHG